MPIVFNFGINQQRKLLIGSMIQRPHITEPWCITRIEVDLNNCIRIYACAAKHYEKYKEQLTKMYHHDELVWQTTEPIIWK